MLMKLLAKWISMVCSLDLALPLMLNPSAMKGMSANGAKLNYVARETKPNAMLRPEMSPLTWEKIVLEASRSKMMA